MSSKQTCKWNNYDDNEEGEKVKIINNPALWGRGGAALRVRLIDRASKTFILYPIGQFAKSPIAGCFGLLNAGVSEEVLARTDILGGRGEQSHWVG